MHYNTSEREADQGACYPNVISCVISIFRACLSFLKEFESFQGSAVEKQVDPLRLQIAHIWLGLPFPINLSSFGGTDEGAWNKTHISNKSPTALAHSFKFTQMSESGERHPVKTSAAYKEATGMQIHTWTCWRIQR